MKYLKAMAAISPKAVNEMLTPLAAGVLAGNEGVTGEHAARIAIDCAEKLLSVTMGDQSDCDGE
jgi:hypothetical protein